MSAATPRVQTVPQLVQRIRKGVERDRMPPRKLYKIGEVMKHTGISRQTLHNYTIMGLIEPAERTDAGHRLYPEDVFTQLKRIERLKRHHTLAEVKKLLKKLGRN